LKPIFYFILLLCMVKVVSATQFTYDINYTELPFYKNETLNYFITENTTLNIIYSEHVFGNLSYVFETSSDSVAIVLQVYIDSTIGIRNVTEYTIINSSSIYNNITFNFRIYNDSYIKETDYIQTDVNSFEYPLCDYLLPYTSFKDDISIYAKTGSNITLTFNNTIFNLSTSIIVSNNNLTVLDIPFTIPNMSYGKNVFIINFNISDLMYNLTFTFNILECIKPLVNLTDLLKKCDEGNYTVNEKEICKIRAFDEYYSSLVDSIIQSQKIKTINSTITEYVNITEYVPVLSLTDSEAIMYRDFGKYWQEYKDKQDDNFNALGEYDEKLKIAQDDYKIDILQLGKEIDGTLSSLIRENSKLHDNISTYENKYVKKSKIWWIATIIIIISLTIWIIIIYQNEVLW